MLPLAATSTQRMIQRLGKRWQALHRLIYACAIAAVVHFLWAVKKDITDPVQYGLILGVLLLYRVAAWQWKRRAPMRPRLEQSAAAD